MKKVFVIHVGDLGYYAKILNLLMKYKPDNRMEIISINFAELVTPNYPNGVTKDVLLTIYTEEQIIKKVWKHLEERDLKDYEVYIYPYDFLFL